MPFSCMNLAKSIFTLKEKTSFLWFQTDPKIFSSLMSFSIFSSCSSVLLLTSLGWLRSHPLTWNPPFARIVSKSCELVRLFNSGDRVADVVHVGVFL